MRPLVTVELFAGIGGFRLAADNCGLRTVWANDMNPKSCAVYRDRFGDAQLHEGDIRALWHEIPTHNLLSAGFPCQPFSSAGKKKGLRGHWFRQVGFIGRRLLAQVSNLKWGFFSLIYAYPRCLADLRAKSRLKSRLILGEA